MTATHAIETDWGRKWAESVGQSLWYSHVTGKRPGVLLLLCGSRREQADLQKLMAVAAKVGIDVWTHDVRRG